MNRKFQTTEEILWERRVLSVCSEWVKLIEVGKVGKVTSLNMGHHGLSGLPVMASHVSLCLSACPTSSTNPQPSGHNWNVPPVMVIHGDSKCHAKVANSTSKALQSRHNNALGNQPASEPHVGWTRCVPTTATMAEHKKHSKYWTWFCVIHSLSSCFLSHDWTCLSLVTQWSGAQNQQNRNMQGTQPQFILASDEGLS